MKFKIKLNTVNDVALFSCLCGEYKETIDYICGRYNVDAKSVMGIISVGLNRVCDVEIFTEEKDVIDKFIKDMKLWIVNE